MGLKINIVNKVEVIKNIVNILEKYNSKED